jgi:urease accessory protein
MTSETDLTTRQALSHRAIVHRRTGEWPQELTAGSLTLDFDVRHGRCLRLLADHSGEVFLDLPRAIAMADGDGLQLDDGRWLIVRAAAEPVIDISHNDPDQLERLAWHLGNRNVPTEIRNQALRIRPDQAVQDMLRGFGATLVRTQAPFQPEEGAYSGDDAGHNHGTGNHDEEA